MALLPGQIRASNPWEGTATDTSSRTSELDSWGYRREQRFNPNTGRFDLSPGFATTLEGRVVPESPSVAPPPTPPPAASPDALGTPTPSTPSGGGGMAFEALKSAGPATSGGEAASLTSPMQEEPETPSPVSDMGDYLRQNLGQRLRQNESSPLAGLRMLY